MSSKSPFAEQEAKDKKMIDRGIVESKRFLESKKFDSAKEKLSQISPASRRLNYKQYDIAILYSFLMTKQEKWQEAKPYVQSATRLKPDEPVPWKLLIQVESNVGTDESMKLTLKRAMETSRPDGSLLFIGPYLKKFDDESLTDSFVRIIDLLPNGLDLPLVTFIPEIPSTLDIRTRMLEKSASNNNEESCSELIHILLSEGDPFKSLKYANIAPPDHPDRLYVETMIGDDPVGSARKHIKTGNNRFFDFLRAVDSHNLSQIRAEVSVIPSFVSGWFYLSTQEKDLKQRILILNDAINKFPKCLSFVKLLVQTKEEMGDIDGAITTIKKMIFPYDEKLGSELLIKLFIRQGRCKEAAELVQNDKKIVVSDFDKASIEMELFKEDHDVSRLKRIVNDLPQSPELASMKAEAAWALRNEEGIQCEQLFAEALRCDRNNGKVFLLFGKWQLTKNKDEEKASFLFTKAAELGFVDNESAELVTRKFLSEGKIDEALEMLHMVDNEWSHFRAALICQRKGDHENAVKEFQHDLRYNPEREISWSAIGHEYIVLGRAMAANSVAIHMREIGKPDLALEFELCSIFGRPITVSEKVDFESNPIPFYAILQQKIETIKSLKRIGRRESAKYIVDQLRETVFSYSKRWDSLSTVLKICGDFFIESSFFDQSGNDARQSLSLYKKRCELDKRAESFIDLAHSIQIQKADDVNKQIEMSIVVLKKVLKSFPDHAGLWTTLGVSYALCSRFPFARHCLCVAAKLATDIEQARSYACCANVALLIDDMKLLDEALEAARSANPYDGDVWQILAATKANSKVNTEANLNVDSEANLNADSEANLNADSEANLNADSEANLKVNRNSNLKSSTDVEEAIIAFQFGASEVVASCLPGLCLKAGRLYEALGFALMIEDDEKIAEAFEAIGKYDMALLYEKDEGKREVLNFLAGKNSESLLKKFPNIELYREAKFIEAGDRFAEKDDLYSQLAAAICYSKCGEVKKSMDIFNSERKKGNFPFLIEKVMLQTIPNSENIESALAQTTPELFFIYQLRSSARIDAARSLIKRFPSDLTAISIFVVEAIKSKAVDAVDDFALTKARALYKAQPGFKSLALMTICLIRLEENEEAIKNLQILCFLNPNIAIKLRNVINEIRKKNQMSH